ncbi:beta-1,3-glucan-binding protein-like [Arctopsyche grandis]|uniref:beta-1,3-glucan-binding protein-like n=1 Tax=Arctopsyche grandis TaxID=121162 RepID=UPI00406D7666
MHHEFKISYLIYKKTDSRLENQNEDFIVQVSRRRVVSINQQEKFAQGISFLKITSTNLTFPNGNTRTHCPDENWEFQWYTNNRTNSYTKNGHLYIRPTLLADQTGEGFLTSGTLSCHGGAPADEAGTPTNIINPTKSARLRSVNSFRFKYGRVEISAKMPAGDWLWPAIWMLPANNEYGTWPSSGEIDLVESRGNRNLVLNGVNIGTHQVGSTLHYGPYPGLNGWAKAHYQKQLAAGYDTVFKKYQMEWTPDYLKFSIDNVEIGRMTPPAGGFWQHGNFNGLAPGTENPWRFGSKMAPFDQEFYFIMNLAVGGTNYFPDNASNPGGKPWNNNSPTAMKDFYEKRGTWLPTWNLGDGGETRSLQVDYVRVWAL